MAAQYQIRLKNAAGTLVAIIDDWQALAYTRTVNAPGGYVLQLDGNSAKCALFELDGQVEIWRRDADHGIAWYKDFEALHRYRRYWLDSDGQPHFQSKGAGYIELLNRRNILYYAGSAQASKSGKAETMMKAFVKENAGSLATLVNGRLAAGVMTGLSVEADGAHGNTFSKADAYGNLLELLQKIGGPIAGGDFDVVGTGAATFEFRWYTGQRGTDRSATVVFALEYDNMAEPELIEDYTQEVNAVICAGQGEGTSRAIVERTDAARIAASTWNRREAFVDGRNYTTTGGLNSAGDERLEQGRPVKTINFKIVQSEGCAYGSHYFLGDLVTARFMDYEETHQIKEATITVMPNTGEQIAVRSAYHV